MVDQYVEGLETQAHSKGRSGESSTTDQDIIRTLVRMSFGTERGRGEQGKGNVLGGKRGK